MTAAKGADWQAGTAACSLPRLVIVDAGSAPAADGEVYRLMDAADMTKLAADSIVQLWNEAKAGEMPPRAKCIELIDMAHALGLKVVYGGDMVDPSTGWSIPPDPVVVAACDYYGLHASVRSQVPPATLYGKPVIVTELEKDPARDEDWALVVPWMAACSVPVFFFTWEWRGGDGRLNLKDRPEVAAGIAALNTEGVAVEAEAANTNDQHEQQQDARIETNWVQVGLLTDLIKAMREGRWTGPGSVDGIYCALKGGIPAPDYTAIFPPQ